MPSLANLSRQSALPSMRAVTACILAAILSACGPAAPAQGVSCGPAPIAHAGLSSAAAASATDLWAVGIHQDRGPMQPLAEHWDGQRWSAVSATSGSWTDAWLAAVSASGPRDVWAIGSGQGMGVQQRTLIEHWDGTAWRDVASANAGDLPNQLEALTVISPNDAWVVGFYQDSARLLALTEHWDGTRWSVVPGVNPAAGINWLSAVSGTSASNVWAVGYRRESNATRPQALVERWDGHGWNVVSDAPAATISHLTSVAVVAPDNVWVAGISGDSFTPLVEHWNGTHWAVEATVSMSNATIGAIAATSSNDVWIAGEAGQGNGVHSLFEHWDGTRWRLVPPATGQTGEVTSLVAVGPSDVWAVGRYRTNSCGPDWTLIQHWDGSAWHRVSSPYGG